MEYLILEIGNEILKIANANYSTSSILIKQVNFYTLPENVSSNNQIIDFEAFSKYLDDCIKEGGFKKEKTILVLNGQKILMKECNHSKMISSNFNSYILQEADSFLPGGKGDYIISGTCYGARKNNIEQQRSAIYAVKKDLMRNLQIAIGKIGLKLVKIVPFIDSYTNFLSEALNDKDGNKYKSKNIATIELGAGMTEIVVFEKGKPISQRTINSVLQNIDLVITENLKISSEKADSYLLRNGLLQYTEENSQNSKMFAEIMKITTSMIEHVMRNVKLTLSSERLELDGIIITGRYSLIPGLAEYIQEATELPCIRIDEINMISLINLSKSAKNNVTGFARLIGIAGSVLNKNGKTINLLPKAKIKEKGNAGRVAVCFLLTLVIILAMLIEPYFYYKAKIQKDENQTILSQPDIINAINIKETFDNLKRKQNLNTTINTNIPAESSKAGDILFLLRTTLSGDVVIGYTTYDNAKQTLTADLYSTSYNELNKTRNSIDATNNYYTTNNSYINQDAKTGIYKYVVEIAMKNNK